MTHIDLLKSLKACPPAVEFAAKHDSIPAAIAACNGYAWLLWAVDNLLTERDRVKVRCHIIRNTPLAGGRTVWDLLTDPRSRARVELEERWANGEDVSGSERTAAWAAAWSAAGAAAGAAAGDAAVGAAGGAARDAAGAAAWSAAGDAARSAAGDAARDAAWDGALDAARQWQMGYIKSLDWNTLTGGEA